jgi:hypothetical protein
MGLKYKRKHGERGRIPKIVRVAKHAVTEGLTPLSKSARELYVRSTRTIYIDLAEMEAQRLVDLEGLSQEEAAKQMAVSRGTVWRLLQSARRKSAQSLSEGRPILILDEEEKASPEDSDSSSTNENEH